MIKSLASKIIFSIAYTDQFKYPLTIQEIFLRLIRVNNSINLTEINKELNFLISSDIILKNKEFYFLNGSKKNVDIRLKRRKFSQKKWLEVDNFVSYAKHIPWIKSIVITGSLSVNNAKQDDDIDFLIITDKKRLWIVRVLITTLAFLKKKKRSRNKEEKNSWCFNMWLDNNSLKLPKKLHNIYGAFEACQSVWVYDKNNTKGKFFKLNNWIKDYLPNYFNYQGKTKASILINNFDKNFIKLVVNKNINDRFFKKILLRMVDGIQYIWLHFLNFINNFLFALQYLYMKPHMTREKVKINYAFFHPRNTKTQIFNNWIRKIESTFSEEKNE